MAGKGPGAAKAQAALSAHFAKPAPAARAPSGKGPGAAKARAGLTAWAGSMGLGPGAAPPTQRAPQGRGPGAAKARRGLAKLLGPL